MNLFDITIHGLRRQKSRKLFLGAAMTISLSAVLILFTFVKSQEVQLESQFDEYGANIIITPKTDDLSLTYGGISLTGIVTNLMEIESEEVSRIYNIPNSKNIRAVSPKLIGVGPVDSDSGRKDVLIVGVDFAEESKIKAWWNVDGRFPETPREVLIGTKAAEKIGLSVGSAFRLDQNEMRVAGVLNSTGSQDDSAIMASMDFVEKLLGKEGKISLVEVSALCSDCPIDDIVAQISTIMPNAEVQALRQVMEQRMQVVHQFSRFALSIFVILTFMCGLFIFSTVAGAVAEKKKEIGILRSVGFARKHIAQVVITEALLLSGAAGVIGIGASLLFIRFALPRISGIAVESVVYDPLLISVGFAALIALAFISAIGPAIKASRYDPVVAIASL